MRTELEERQQKVGDEFDQSRNEERAKQRERDGVEKNIAALERKKQDIYQVYGSGIQQVLSLIKKHESQFSRPPIGPLGNSS